MRAEVKREGAFGEGAAVDKFGACLRQRPFVERGKFFIQFLRENQLQHGIAEKFQPLIMRYRRIVFVCDGRMREREAQQAFVAEFVTETGLKFGGF